MEAGDAVAPVAVRSGVSIQASTRRSSAQFRRLNTTFRDSSPDMRALRIPAIAISLSTGILPAQSAPETRLTPGPHTAGFRLIESWDRGRTTRPPTDYAGRRAPGEIAVPIQLAVWYPATRPPNGTPLKVWDMQLAVATDERLGRPTAADSASAREAVGFAVQRARADSTRADARPESVLARTTASYRDATPADGSFPVAVIAAGHASTGMSALAEYLATHGWVIVAVGGQTPASSAQQINNPQIAIDVGLRAIEFAVATAATLPQADIDRLAIIGVNFDSFSALEFQMRYMRARVIVTINGWETIESRASALRASLWYEPARIRVPVLNVHWDELGANPPDRSYLETLKYSERRSLIIAGLDHFGLIGDPLVFPFVSATQRVGHQYLIRAVLAALSNAVGATNDAFLEKPAADLGFPADVVKDAWHRSALPAIPTRQEFADLIWEQRDIATATRVFRAARVRDSSVQVFTEQDMGIYAFRYQQARRFDDAVAVHRLTIEAYPASALARNGIGNVLLAKADTAGAIREFEAALQMLEKSTTLSDQEKTSQAQVWRAKIARLSR
jgi:hypothetical protein